MTDKLHPTPYINRALSVKKCYCAIMLHMLHENGHDAFTASVVSKVEVEGHVGHLTQYH